MLRRLVAASERVGAASVKTGTVPPAARSALQMHPPQSAGCATIRSATSSCKWQQNNGIKGVSPMQLRRISFTVAATLFLLAAQAPALAADRDRTSTRLHSSN